MPIVTHLHGGEVPSAFDGHTEACFTPGLAIKGPTYVTNAYIYPNGQEATTLWCHDHALGITRLDVYAGLDRTSARSSSRTGCSPTTPLGSTDPVFGYPGGPGYVWHCHILEHEDNEMMRPLVIKP